jgi:hypothetical protein
MRIKMVARTLNKSFKILSFFKTYPSGMEEKLSLGASSTSIGIPKRFHCIHCQRRIKLISINFSNTHFTRFSSLRMLSKKLCIRSISTSSVPTEAVLIYTNPEEHKGLIAKQNKGKSGVYR